ncbi:MAG: hypothetical protein LUD69_07525 [Oscillospiraceae bacterium]|nr:hypothetical protein [Oscillospiraceae bacterium]
MKKTVILLLALALFGAAAGCGDSGGSASRASNQQSGVEDVLQAGTEEEAETEDAGQTDAGEETSGSSQTASAGAVDVDLTQLSSTMVYSEVYNMMVAPEGYIGKTVRMSGQFAIYHDESTDVYYFACIIADATACCSQGIEFVLTGAEYPDDYPEMGEEITVSGVFQTYQEGEFTYCTLLDAVLEV